MVQLKGHKSSYVQTATQFYMIKNVPIKLEIHIKRSFKSSVDDYIWILYVYAVRNGVKYALK